MISPHETYEGKKWHVMTQFGYEKLPCNCHPFTRCTNYEYMYTMYKDEEKGQNNTIGASDSQIGLHAGQGLGTVISREWEFRFSGQAGI